MNTFLLGKAHGSCNLFSPYNRIPYLKHNSSIFGFQCVIDILSNFYQYICRRKDVWRSPFPDQYSLDTWNSYRDYTSLYFPFLHIFRLLHQYSSNLNIFHLAHVSTCSFKSTSIFWNPGSNSELNWCFMHYLCLFKVHLIRLQHNEDIFHWDRGYSFD